MSHPLLALPISITLILIAAAFGRKLLALLGVKADTPLERSVFGIGLGFSALSYLILAIGLAGFLHAWVLGVAVMFIGIYSVREFVQILTELAQGIRRGARTRLSAAGGLILFATACAGILVLILSLSPPSAMDWDGLSYHLAVPQVYLSHHRVMYVPYDSHSNFPFLLEMLYTLGLSFGSIGAAKLFHFAMYATSAMAVYSLSRRHLNTAIAAIGALAFMTVPVVMWEAGSAYADIATALYVTLAVYAIVNWEQSHTKSWLVLCGLMCGFALSTKVLASVPTMALCLWILLSAKTSDGWGRGFRSALLVGGLALLVGSPWYIKSFAYTGNPVYPFLYGIFGGKYWSASAAAAYSNAQSAFGMGHSLKHLILSPWNLTENGAFFFDDPNARSPKLFSLIGPVFLALIPLGILAGGRNKLIARLGFVCASYMIAWFFLMQQVRYLIGVLPLLAIIAAWGLDSANRKWRFTRLFANGFFAFSVLLSLLTGCLLAAGSAPAALGLEPASAYLSRTLDAYDTESYANESLPSDAKIVFFDEVRGFYLNREYMWGNPGHHEMTPWATFKTGGDMVSYFRSRGFTYALVNWNLAKYSGNDLLHGKLLVESIGRGRMIEVYASHGVTLYELVGK